MIGKQFSFYLGPSDQIGFEEAIRASGEIAFLLNWPHSQSPQQLPTSRVLAMGKEALRLLIARTVDQPQIEFRPIKGRDDFSCSTTFSPVIEFDRCYVTDRFIRAGRLYRVDRYWNEHNHRESKPAAFTAWADRLYRLAKKSLVKVEHGYYAGAEAIELRKRGVAFEGLDIPIGSIAS